MRIATWNINSIRTRAERAVAFLQNNDIDVLALQEIKCKPEQFPYAIFEDAGYSVEAHGLNQWNGVALVSRHPIEDVETSFAGQPGFAKGHNGPDAPLEARAIGATIGGIRLWSLYVPNGRSLTDEHYDYKLRWFDALRDASAAEIAAEPSRPFAIMGDFNVIPFDDDNGDPTIVKGVSTHVSDAERERFFALETAGLKDVVRPLIPTGYTYWDYQQLKFPRDQGIRIDFILGNDVFAGAVTGAEIARDERKGDQPSDHVPVIVDVTLGESDADDVDALSLLFG